MAENTQIAALTKQPKTFTLPPPPELGGIIKQIGGVPGVPYTPPTDYAEERKKFKTSTDVSTREAELLQRQDQLDKEIGAVKQAVDQYRAEAGASIATQKREEAEQTESNLDAIRKKFPYEAFHPTKDNIQDLATLFSLIGVIGVAMGGSGKQSAMMSLNAMSGMMKGWQQGRADLWKKEKEEFDKNMQRTKAILEDAYRDADRARKLQADRAEEANALVEQSAAKLGGQIGKQILEKQGIQNYFKFIDEIKRDLTNIEDWERRKQLAREQQEAADRRQQAGFAHAERMQERSFRHAEAMVQIRKGLQGKALAADKLEKLDGLHSMEVGLKKLKDDFKPEYASLGFLGFGADMSLEAKRRLGNEEGRKAVSWWSRYDQLQAPNRHTLFGATLTGNELKNYRDFTAKKSDAADIIKDKLNDQINYTRDLYKSRRNAFESAGYTVDQLSPRKIDYEKSTKGAPEPAVKFLIDNPTEQNKKFFEEKYGYLP
jgi:hypothetical protein